MSVTKTVAREELLTAADLAVQLQVTAKTIHKWARTGKVPCRVIGGMRYFDLMKVLAAGDGGRGKLARAARRAGKKASEGNASGGTPSWKLVLKPGGGSNTAGVQKPRTSSAEN